MEGKQRENQRDERQWSEREHGERQRNSADSCAVEFPSFLACVSFDRRISRAILTVLSIGKKKLRTWLVIVCRTIEFN